MDYSKKEVVDLLNKNVCLVKFKKVNGKNRVMKCSRNTGSYFEEVTGDAIAVWDFDKSGYRSFRYSSVTDISVV